MISYTPFQAPDHHLSCRSDLQAIIDANERYNRTLQGNSQKVASVLSRTPSIPESLDTYIPAGDLSNDQDMSGFLLNPYDDEVIRQKEQPLLRSTFQNDVKKFYLPCRDSVTDSILGFGDSLCRPLSVLLPDAVSTEGITFIAERAAPFRPPSDASSGRTLALAPMHNRRSVTPSQFDYLACELSNLRQSYSFSSTTSTVAPSTPVPSLIHSFTTGKGSWPSSRSQSSRCPSSTHNHSFCLCSDFRARPCTSDTLYTAGPAALYSECYKIYMDKPLPDPTRQSPAPSAQNYHVEQPARHGCPPHVSRAVSRPIPQPDHTARMRTAYQAPRQAPPTPTLQQDQFKSHMDWSEDESHGIKTKLKSATKSFTDLRQAASRRRADSNRTPQPQENVDGLFSQRSIREPSPVPRVFRVSNGSGTVSDRFSRDPDATGSGKTCTSTTSDNPITNVPGFRYPKRSTSGKLKKNPSARQRRTQRHASTEGGQDDTHQMPTPPQQLRVSVDHHISEKEGKKKSRSKVNVKKTPKARVVRFLKLMQWFKRLRICG